MAKLEAIFDHLLTRARSSGRDQHADLPGGARLAVRVAGPQITVSVARLDKDVGTTEEVTFQRICQVPPHARRIPETGQGRRVAGDRTWHMLGWVWSEDDGQARLALEEHAHA